MRDLLQKPAVRGAGDGSGLWALVGGKRASERRASARAEPQRVHMWAILCLVSYLSYIDYFVNMSSKSYITRSTYIVFC